MARPGASGDLITLDPADSQAQQAADQRRDGGTTRIDLHEDPPNPPPFVLPILTAIIWTPAPLTLAATNVKANVLSRAWRQADALHGLGACWASCSLPGISPLVLLREPICLQAVGQMARVTHRDHMTAVDLVDLEA